MNRITPLILAVALFMEMMDATVIATSLPAIAEDIGTEPIALKLAMTAYLVSLAMFIPLSGWFADRFGAKNVFRWAIFVFMLGSLACAFSFSLESFVASRFFQGVGGSMMTPLARTVLVRATPRKDLVNAMAWLTLPALLGPLLGPPVGGFLTTFFHWQWIFLINIPIGLAGIIASSIYLPDIESEEPKPIDWPGFFLTSAAFSGLLFGLSVISLPALPPIVGVVTALAGLVSLIAYLIRSRFVSDSILDPRIFRHKNFRDISIASFVFRVAMGTTPFLLPLMLQLGFGYTPFESGLVMLFGAVGAISAKSFVKPVFKRFGYRRVSLLTILVSTSAFFFSAMFEQATPMVLMMSVMMMAGLARSTFFTGSNAVLFGDVDPRELSQASSIFAVSVQLGLASGVALAGGLLELRIFLSGHETQVSDFHFAFMVAGLVSLLSLIPILRMPDDAGAEVSGHQARRGENPSVGGG